MEDVNVNNVGNNVTTWYDTLNFWLCTVLYGTINAEYTVKPCPVVSYEMYVIVLKTCMYLIFYKFTRENIM